MSDQVADLQRENRLLRAMYREAIEQRDTSARTVVQQARALRRLRQAAEAIVKASTLHEADDVVIDLRDTLEMIP